MASRIKIIASVVLVTVAALCLIFRPQAPDQSQGKAKPDKPIPNKEAVVSLGQVAPPANAPEPSIYEIRAGVSDKDGPPQIPPRWAEGSKGAESEKSIDKP